MGGRVEPSLARYRIETTVVVLSWFVLNIAMASSTKWLFLYGLICSPAGDCEPYRFPLAITVVHMVFSWCMCCGHIFVFRGGLSGPAMSFRQQLEKIAPLAGVFSLSVAMGNLSLKYIYPSFNQMLGAMSPLITVLMAIVLQQKRYNRSTWLSMLFICGGLAVCGTKEVNFHVVGALYCLGATILRAAKSLMQGKLLTDKLDSVTLLFYMAPWAAALLSVLMLFSEGVEPVQILLRGFIRAQGVAYVLFLLLVSGLNACLLNVFNFLATSYTSAVTLQVLGNVKSCLSIGISVLIFRNAINVDQVAGVLTTLFGVWYYNKYGGTAGTGKGKIESSQEVELTKEVSRNGASESNAGVGRAAPPDYDVTARPWKQAAAV